MQFPRLILPDEFFSQLDSAPDITTYVHQRITVALQRSRIPWQVPVSHDPNCGLPTNVRTGGRYRGVNTLLLCDTYETKGYRSKWWGTYEDWAAAGATVKGGQEPTVIVRYCGGDQVESDLAFNAVQVQGADSLLAILTELKTIVPNDEADFGLMGRLIEHHSPDIRFDVGDDRFGPEWNGYITPEPFHDYPNHKSGDYILMQSEGHFMSRADHFSVMLHELMHWAEVRTGWMHCMPLRELVAEMGMHVLGLELGVPHCFDEYNHRKWLKEWNLIFPQDHRLFFWITAQMDRVCDYLLGPILHRKHSDYHDQYRIIPEVNHITGPEFMDFRPKW
ncbi:ArdC-like ssDNA-binding domain-containing protein [Bremerella sp. P1]|uniref:ArdC-like ssDNA-binding domain-containing protein n=1 Tax=Bremerella sp. P1 TaxID=3026424 RepID=UPI00236832C9|nr:ArdC-like ssDNA-binding domain-containing protein [Bremerella sp. P1]WDI43720.1 ArdC-like ssDNA-binding domain-containing protein [Bremerella sp. P1]